MGRSVPDDNLLLIHPVLYFSFFAAGFAASIAIITAMCSVSFRRKQSPPPTQSDPLEIAKDLDTSAPSSATVATTQSPQEQSQVEKSEAECTTETEDNEVQVKELPLPPAMQQPKDSFPSNNMKRATSERRASFSLSLKMPRTLSVARNWDQKEDKEKNNIKGKLKAEDSVWMKTIILGEKCVPGEEDPVIYEGKGKRISVYHPKNNSRSLSRQWSCIDTDALSVPQPRTQEERINNT